MKSQLSSRLVGGFLDLWNVSKAFDLSQTEYLSAQSSAREKEMILALRTSRV